MSAADCANSSDTGNVSPLLVPVADEGLLAEVAHGDTLFNFIVALYDKTWADQYSIMTTASPAVRKLISLLLGIQDEDVNEDGELGDRDNSGGDVAGDELRDA